MTGDRYTITGLKRGLAFLRGFGSPARAMTLAEIARPHDLPRATAFRLVRDPGGYRPCAAVAAVSVVASEQWIGEGATGWDVRDCVRAAAE